MMAHRRLCTEVKDFPNKPIKKSQQQNHAVMESKKLLLLFLSLVTFGPKNLLIKWIRAFSRMNCKSYFFRIAAQSRDLISCAQLKVWRDDAEIGMFFVSEFLLWDSVLVWNLMKIEIKINLTRWYFIAEAKIYEIDCENSFLIAFL